MNVNVSVLCSACKECEKFEVEQEDFYNTCADGNIAEITEGKYFYCKYLNICQNAVRIWEKQNETD